MSIIPIGFYCRAWLQGLSLLGFRGFKGWLLDLAAVAKVAGVAEARYDVFVLVEARVDRCAPDGGVFREGLADVVDAVGRCDDTYHVHLLRLAPFSKILLLLFISRTESSRASRI